ncbi:hypothetical protein BC30040_3727 [Bacillus cereus]|nr:hypothetical protein BC30040_3727 [Bacillus cereus]
MTNRVLFAESSLLKLCFYTALKEVWTLTYKRFSRVQWASKGL